MNPKTVVADFEQAMHTYSGLTCLAFDTFTVGCMDFVYQSHKLGGGIFKVADRKAFSRKSNFASKTDGFSDGDIFFTRTMSKFKTVPYKIIIDFCTHQLLRCVALFVIAAVRTIVAATTGVLDNDLITNTHHTVSNGRP